jgi:hypothetical protein
MSDERGAVHRRHDDVRDQKIGPVVLRQHIEHRLFVDHNEPRTRSHVTYKGALQGHGAHAVWIGNVLIRKEAEGIETYEENRNLVLTDGCRADSVPNLEIETGEIAGAGHASATGRFDDEQLFYLQSRGIPADEARRLVVRGFFADVINQIGIPDVQERLLAAVEALVAQHGGDQGGGRRERTASFGGDYDAFGNRIDGREEEMRDVVWRAVLEWYRECPIKPPEIQWRAQAEAAYLIYERRVKSRLEGADKTELLEREGRGPTAFWEKWRREMKNWGSPKMVEEAAKPNPKSDEPPPEESKVDPQTGEDVARIVSTIISTPPAIVAKVKAITDEGR